MTGSWQGSKIGKSRVGGKQRKMINCVKHFNQKWRLRGRSPKSEKLGLEAGRLEVVNCMQDSKGNDGFVAKVQNRNIEAGGSQVK